METSVSPELCAQEEGHSLTKPPLEKRPNIDIWIVHTQEIQQLFSGLHGGLQICRVSIGTPVLAILILYPWEHGSPEVWVEH